MEQQDATVEIARLEALVAGDAGAPGFPALAEANRRAGRVKEAERVARDGLRHHPAHVSGRVSLALALLDLGRNEDARTELRRVLEHAPDHPVALDALEGAPEPIGEIADEELDRAFSDAEARVDAMVDANDVASEAVRAAALDAPEGVLTPEESSPFATATMADLLASQGHAEEAEAVRTEVALRDSGDDPAATNDGLSDEQRSRVIETLQLWLENLRGTK